MRIGSQIAYKAKFLGKELAKVVNNIRDKKFVIWIYDEPFPVKNTYSWESINETHTRMVGEKR